MKRLQLLAREATDLGRRGAELGHVSLASSGIAEWTLDVYVNNSFAYHHCTRIVGEGDDLFGIIRIVGHDLDTVIDQALERVADAVADTPCEQVPA